MEWLQSCRVKQEYFVIKALLTIQKILLSGRPQSQSTNGASVTPWEEVANETK